MIRVREGVARARITQLFFFIGISTALNTVYFGWTLRGVCK